LVQVAVPSRGDVEEYQNLRTTVNELVGRINGQFGSIEFMPIHYMHQSVDFTELVALYNVSDVCLVSSTRDGMNLVNPPFIPPPNSPTLPEWGGFLLLISLSVAGHALYSVLMAGFVRIHLHTTTTPRGNDSLRICGGSTIA